MEKILLEDFKLINQYIIDKEAFIGSRWLVTGSTGMIGSYLLSFLSWLNEKELGGSIEITAFHRSELSSDDHNLGHLLKKKHIKFRQIDLSNDFELSQDDNYNYVIHAASNAAPKSYLEDPIGTINTNVKATQIMLEHFKQSSGLRAFLFVSSGEVYGSPDISNIPTPEDYLGITDNLSQRSCYVESKRFAETLSLNYFMRYAVPVKILRPVHVFGPGFREDDSRVWADFIIKAVSGENIEILGDGLSRRGFCYLADAITQVLAVLQKGNPGEVYNIGSDEHFSIKDLATAVSEGAGNNIKILIKNNLPNYLQGSPQISCPSVRKVRELSPLLKTTLHEGIQKSVNWFKNVKR